MEWYSILALAVLIYMLMRFARATVYVAALMKEYKENPKAAEKKLLDGLRNRAHDFGLSDAEFDNMCKKAKEESEKKQ